MAMRSLSSFERRERERGETRRKILDAARRMFVQQGYEGTTMRAIAAKIGYTPTAIYHHFKDKDALVAELSALDFRALTQALQRVSSLADPVARLDKMGEEYVEFGLTHPMQYQFMFMTRRPQHGAVDATRGDPGAQCYDFLRQTCSDVIATGRLRPQFSDADELAQIAWGSLHGLVALQVTRNDDPAFEWRDVRQTAARMRDALIRGMLREPEG